jgi:catechol 2,3-dioxygenase-like lactoylglutathione lyase family enzyme
MEGFVAKQVDDYQNGRISRRRLIEILTLAATTACAGKQARGAAQSGLEAALVNHVSYTCPDFRRAADWYAMLFNLDQIGATARDVALPFGKKGEKPYGVSADDVPLTHLICRTRPADAPAGNASARRKAKAAIDHICFTVADFDRERAKAQLGAMEVKNVRDGGPFSVYVNDPFGYEVQIAGLSVTAICGAESTIPRLKPGACR